MSQRGSYQTRRQEGIEALFREQPEACLTVEEAYQALLKKGVELGRTTVYRSITRLCQSGRLRRYAAADSGGAARFQYNPCQESHLHIRCVHCGALAHLRCEEADAFSRHLVCQHGFTLDVKQTILYGCCDSCRQKEQK